MSCFSSFLVFRHFIFLNSQELVNLFMIVIYFRSKMHYNTGEDIKTFHRAIHLSSRHFECVEYHDIQALAVTVISDTELNQEKIRI